MHCFGFIPTISDERSPGCHSPGLDSQMLSSRERRDKCLSIDSQWYRVSRKTCHVPAACRAADNDGYINHPIVQSAGKAISHTSSRRSWASWLADDEDDGRGVSVWPAKTNCDGTHCRILTSTSSCLQHHQSPVPHGPTCNCDSERISHVSIKTLCKSFE